jgi:hypothetical protein
MFTYRQDLSSQQPEERRVMKTKLLVLAIVVGTGLLVRAAFRKG